MDGYYSHDGTLAKLISVPTTMKGNTPQQGSLYRRGNVDRSRRGAASYTKYGRSRLLIDADGVANVPVEGNGSPFIPTCSAKRWWQMLMITTAPGLYRFEQTAGKRRSHEISVQATLTEGAIGYRKFAVISGRRRWQCCACRMAAIRHLGRNEKR